MCWERKKKKEERKNIRKKETEERVKETEVLRDFSGCRGSSFLFVLLKGKALISGSGTWMFATPMTSFLFRHLQRMHK